MLLILLFSYLSALHLNPFQSGFRSGYEIVTALVTLMGDLCWKQAKCSYVDCLGPLSGFQSH